ncbi:unnamed protein product [Danaus chrysippus]|uniref:(African queen) hypothetical protein n=1 Tax=Danaus chrysippus TaxID=151541 RepID=A0A8J2R0Z2_9NEOP|nr:unnamed protein product [Danaus chrysippus]
MMTSTPKSEKCIQDNIGDVILAYGALVGTGVRRRRRSRGDAWSKYFHSRWSDSKSQGSRASAAAPLLGFAPLVTETSRHKHAPLTITSFVRCSAE